MFLAVRIHPIYCCDTKIPMAVELYTLVKADEKYLSYNMCYHGNKAAVNERKVGQIILIKTTNKKYHTAGTIPKSNIKHDS